MKKVLALLLAVTMVFGLSGCGGSDSKTESSETAAEGTKTEESTETQETAKDPKDVTLTVWVSAAGGQVDAMKAAVDQFAADTGYNIEFSAPGDTYEELMKTKMAANDMPDVFDTHGWSVARYSEYLEPVNDLDFTQYIDDQIKAVISNADGQMFVLPLDMDIAGIVYNVDVLNEAGVDVDSIKTWSDFEDACDKVLAIGKNPIHMGGSDSFTVGWYYDRVAPSFYITDEANSKAADLKNGVFDQKIWEQMSSMLDSWVTAGYLNKDCVSSEYMSDVTAIASDETAFVFYGNVAVPLAQGINENVNLGMMPLPSNSDADEPSLIAGENVALGIWKDSDVKPEAIELLNYLAQPEVAKTIAQATGNKSALTNVTVDLGMIQSSLEKYANVETFPYFDREYCPSGMWDTICASGQEVLAQKDGAIESTAKLVLDTFNEKFGQ